MKKRNTEKKTIEVKSFISDLLGFLRNTDADEVIVRTTYVRGCWYDNEFEANRAGFSICRFQNPEYLARHEFAECYRITRR